MKIYVALMSLIVAMLLVAARVDARDDRLHLSIKDAMETADAKAKLTGEIKFFFGSQKYPKPAQTMGTFTSNKKSNFANKSDKVGCDYVFLSALLALQDRAVKEGGNAVVDIHSIYKNAPFKSETEYECGAGSFVGGVALRGTVVKL
ncbi:MAG TPA: hypothetical protein VET48_01570 [Steroidobacteraceae bacterium]|nr:hypothetical protein [Steroidobacteraceae bacterium]